MLKINFFLFIILTACNAKNSNSNFILSGNIKNFNSDTLTILDYNNNEIFHILLAKEKSFNDTLSFKEGYYHFFINDNKIKIYLKPHFNLNITLNAKNPYKSIKFEGIGARENKYLLKKYFLENNLGEHETYKYYAKLNERVFLDLTDSIYNEKKKLLQKQPKLNEGFYSIELKDIKYEKLFRIANYQDYHRFITGDMNFEVSSSFPNAFKNIELSNDKLLQSVNYHLVLEKYFLDETNKKWIKNPSIDFVFTLLKTVDTSTTNKKIKEEFAYYFLTNFLTRTKRIDDVYKIFNSLVENKSYRQKIKKKYLIYKKISKGSISPTFSFPDIHNQLVSLESLKGSYIYIDIWATWCLPCIKTIPQFEKLKRDFKNKNIKFVSICKNDSKERWKKMVKEKKLSDIQLFAPDKNVVFFKDYLVNGVPRYILIDKEGRIIDAFAKDPSHPKLKLLLNSLL